MTQQPSLTELEAQLANQEAQIQTLQDRLDELTRPSPRTVSRREALAMLSGGALVGVAVAGAGGQLLVNEATAQAVAEGSIGTEDNPLEEIYVEDWYANQEHLELETLDVTGAGITTTGLVADNVTVNNSLTVDGALTTEVANNKRDARQLASSGVGTWDDPLIVTDDIFDEGRAIRFSSVTDDRNTFGTSGLTLPSDFSWDSTETEPETGNVVIEGDGVRAPTLKLVDDAGLTAEEGMLDYSQIPDGNFGTIKNIRFHGNRENNEDGNIVLVENIIDLIVRDVIFRYPATDCIRFKSSASGFRLFNSWIETSNRDLIHMESGGTRCKLVGNHIVISERHGLVTDVALSQFVGNTYSSIEEIAIWLKDTSWSEGENNTFVGETVSHDGNQEAIRIDSNGNQFFGIRVTGTSADITINGNENQIYGWIDGDIADNGDRNVINGLSLNDGPPVSTGAWNGHSDLAYTMGTLVVNESTGSYWRALEPQAAADWEIVSRDGYETLFEKELDSETLNETISLPDYISSRGEGKVKIEASLGEDNEADDVDLNLQLDDIATNYDEHQWQNGGSIFERENRGLFRLLRASDSNDASSGEWYLTYPRFRAVIHGGGSNVRLTSDNQEILAKGACRGIPDRDDITVSTSDDVEGTVRVAAKPTTY